MTSKRKIHLIVIHCSATKADQYVKASTIKKWHTDPKPDGRGWSDIGYHYFIRRNGVVELGRDVSKRSAHAKGYIADSIGICLAGGLSKDGKSENNFTAKQMESARHLILKIKGEHPIDTVCGHRDLSGASTECPGFDVTQWLDTFHASELESEVAEIEQELSVKGDDTDGS